MFDGISEDIDVGGGGNSSHSCPDAHVGGDNGRDSNGNGTCKTKCGCFSFITVGVIGDESRSDNGVEGSKSCGNHCSCCGDDCGGVQAESTIDLSDLEGCNSVSCGCKCDASDCESIEHHNSCDDGRGHNCAVTAGALQTVTVTQRILEMQLWVAVSKRVQRIRLRSFGDIPDGVDGEG